MPSWSATPTYSDGGRFQIVLTKPGGTATDVTYFRGAPTRIESYSNADPFGDAACVLTFPQITGFDDLQSADAGQFLAPYSDVDIYWVDATAGTDIISPITGKFDIGLVTIRASRPNQAHFSHTTRVKVWEGFIANFTVTADENASSMQVQCQGALFQLDRYLQKPFYPPRPWPFEALIADTFSHTRKPHLRTKPLKIDWPTGWTKVVPAYSGDSQNVYAPVAKPGSKYTGYSTRSTGAWDHALTGFTQDLLATMFVDENSGVTPGNQWTIGQGDERQPWLYVRDRFRAPDFTVWFGQTGVSFNLDQDTTQMANIIYGEGTGVDGTVWRNAQIANDGSRTDYLPLAASPLVYPATEKKFDRKQFVSEAFNSYGSGFQLDQAIASAKKTLQRDLDPGWSGSMNITIDPGSLNRFKIRAGMSVLVKGFLGTGGNGMLFHIAEVEITPESGSVQCKIDTRFRDLLTLEEALARTRDPLTPAKMLQVNRRSLMVEDIMAPWDYTAGSGFITKASTRFHSNRPATTVFPWTDWLKKYPPRFYPGYYVKVNAYKAKRWDRWTCGAAVPILTAEKGSIRHTEVVCCDKYGNILKIPFHFSIYYTKVTPSAMPKDANGPSPFLPGAFESIAANGAPTPLLAPDQTMIIGWGNRDEPAGYSPGRKSAGFPATGLLVDDAGWSYDNTNNPMFDKGARPGQKQPSSAITLYGAFYAEYKQEVYFIGRIYKQDPGT